MNKVGLLFSIQTMQVKDGKALRAMEPNKDGVYENVPLGAIGIASRNAAFYEPQSVAQCMSSPNSAFYKKLIEGNLRGEWGHPLIKTREDLARVVHIDMSRVSHAITKIETRESSDGSFVIIYGDIKPTGPYGKDLDTSFKDPTINTSFSLRSLCSKPTPMGNVQKKRMLSMVTFDAVDGPGYEIASKRYASNECLLSISDVVANDEIKELLGLENENATNELFDMLCDDTVNVAGIGNIICDPDAGVIVTPNQKESVFHSMFSMTKHIRS